MVVSPQVGAQRMGLDSPEEQEDLLTTEPSSLEDWYISTRERTLEEKEGCRQAEHIENESRPQAADAEGWSGSEVKTRFRSQKEMSALLETSDFIPKVLINPGKFCMYI